MMHVHGVNYPLILCPSFSTPVVFVRQFPVLHFPPLQIYKFVRHFPVLHFPALQLCSSSFSSPAFSCPAFQSPLSFHMCELSYDGVNAYQYRADDSRFVWHGLVAFAVSDERSLLKSCQASLCIPTSDLHSTSKCIHSCRSSCNRIVSLHTNKLCNAHKMSIDRQNRRRNRWLFVWQRKRKPSAIKSRGYLLLYTYTGLELFKNS